MEAKGKEGKGKGRGTYPFFEAPKWQEVGKRRKFFENYAKENGFDPLSPENWYLQPIKKILSVIVLPLPLLTCIFSF
jgi:hypothetical protein